MNSKLISIIFISILLASTGLFAVETKVGGFLALDLLQYQQGDMLVSRKGFNSGIGAIDLKVRMYSGDTSFKLKLDLDGHLKYRYTLFEEATVTQGLYEGLKIKAGKGVVAFHGKHNGPTELTYIEGTSLMGDHDWSYGDQDKALLLSVIYGGYKQGYKNTLTVYGKSNMTVESKEGEEDTIDSDSQKEFNLSKQVGLANRFDYYVSKALTVSVAGLYYQHDLISKDSYSVLLDVVYRDGGSKYWFETAYGKTYLDGHPRYGSIYDRDEFFVQLGGNYELVKNKWNVALDLETVIFDGKGEKSGVEWEKVGSIQKLDFGVIRKLNRNIEWVNGVVCETLKKKDSVRKYGYKLETSMALFF